MGGTQTARWTGHMRKLPFPQMSTFTSLGFFLLLTVTPLPTSSDSSLMLATLSHRVSDLSFFSWPSDLTCFLFRSPVLRLPCGFFPLSRLFVFLPLSSSAVLSLVKFRFTFLCLFTFFHLPHFNPFSPCQYAYFYLYSFYSLLNIDFPAWRIICFSYHYTWPKSWSTLVITFMFRPTEWRWTICHLLS